MPVVFQGQVGPGFGLDNQPGTPRLTKELAMVVQELNGKYYEQVYRGNMFVYATTSAAAIAALGNNNPSIFNPAGSGKNVVIVKTVLGLAAVGTPVMSTVQYGTITKAGSGTATGGPVLTGTFVSATNALIGGGNNSVVLWAPAAITFTTAPGLLATAGLNFTATASGENYLVDDVDGRIVVAPGSVLQIAASTATSTTALVAIWGIELPI